MQTLLQLVEEHKTDLKIPYLEIEDYPKFAYRGMMLDVSRHFFNAEEVKTIWIILLHINTISSTGILQMIRDGESK